MATFSSLSTSYVNSDRNLKSVFCLSKCLRVGSELPETRMGKEVKNLATGSLYTAENFVNLKCCIKMRTESERMNEQIKKTRSESMLEKPIHVHSIPHMEQSHTEQAQNDYANFSLLNVQRNMRKRPYLVSDFYISASMSVNSVVNVVTHNLSIIPLEHLRNTAIEQ